MIGHTFSHYRIVDEIGSGGMGVVYRAVDVRLEREVALKFLPAEMAQDPDALARFDREARLASSLNHPHICTVHDVGQHEGRPFIVMELCAGRTVRELIAGGPVPLERVTDIAIRIAEALDAAHRRGIVHRDIKPANLFVIADLQVKVLDFGLAKLVEGAPRQATPIIDDSWRRLAIPDELTRPGVALGTVAYMSPEQALGQPLDARTNLFSLGAVVYEMATGQRAFPGQSVALVYDGILNRDPVPPRQIDPALPVELEAILRRMLAKPREARYQDAAALLQDLRALKRVLETPRPFVPLPSPEPEGIAAPAGRGRGLRWTAVLAVILLAIASGGALFSRLTSRPADALSSRDPLLLAGFQNHTGEPVFDGTLGQALAVQLTQSPFLNIVPEERVREALRSMGRAPDERPTGDVAREVCQRLGLKAMVEGSISRLGTLYVLLVDATNCASGTSLAREQGSAATQEQVLPALGRIAFSLRGRLGESLRSVQRYDIPVAEATTPSLDALKAYTLGIAQRSRGAELESIPFLEHALDLDPKFGAAATTLSTVYGNLGEFARSERYARLAYEHRGHVSERERLFITYQYHDRVTGDQSLAADTLEVWKQTYPTDFRPANALAILYNRVGRFDRAVVEGQEALRRSPEHPFPLSNLAYAFRGSWRLDDARRTAMRAVELGIETVPTRRLLYQLAVLAHDDAEAARHLDWASGKTREFDLVSAQAQVAAHDGRLRESDELYRKSIELADRRDLHEAAGAYQAHQALTHALYGDRSRALAHARAAIDTLPRGDMNGTSIPRYRALVALALLGAPEVGDLLRSADQRYPQSTFTQGVLLPACRAAGALERGRPAEAIEHLRAAAPYELGTVAALIPPYLRGQAYLALRAGPEALREFRRILDNRGGDPFSPVSALARLGLARAWRLSGDEAASAREYTAFLEQWRGADADVPILVDARAERDRLTARTH